MSLNVINKLKHYLKVTQLNVLLWIVVFYLGNITAYQHTHMVDGTGVSHSHYYNQGDSSSPLNHHKTAKEVYLIAELTSFSYDKWEGFPLIQERIFSLSINNEIETIQSLVLSSFQNSLSLRGPPVN